MSLQAILALLAQVFKAAYHYELVWYGGHGNEPTAFTPDPDKPNFVITLTTGGWYIAFNHGHLFGYPNVKATRWLARGHDPREVCHV